MHANGLQLPTVGGLELEICLGSIIMKSNTYRPICTIPPIVGRCCYGQLIIFLIVVLFSLLIIVRMKAPLGKLSMLILF